MVYGKHESSDSRFSFVLNMEEGAITIRLLNLLTSKSTDDQRPTHLDIVRYLLLKNTNAKEIVSKVNKSLSTAATRDRGYELLSELLEFLPVEVVSTNAVSWIKIALGQHPKEKVKPLRLGVIGRLIDQCSNVPEFKKVVVADYLAEIIDACLKSDDTVLSQHSLSCLNTCILKFPGSCLPFKNHIEASLSKCLDYQGEDVAFLKKAAVAYHYMNQIGGGGTDGIIHQHNWTKQLENVCSLTQETLKELKAELIEEGTSKTAKKKLRNCIVFLKIMFEKHYPVAKVIPLETVLEVICNGMDDHECISASLLAKSENSYVLAKMQVDMLYLFRSFLACAQQRLIPFSLTINKMLVNYLRRIHSCDCFKNSSVYSEAVYNVIGFWVKTVRNAFHHSFHEKLLRYIMDDISPVIQKVTLQLNVANNSHGGKKKAQNLAKVTSTTSESKVALSVKEYREKVCLHALHTLKIVLKSIYLKINKKLTQELYEIVTKTLINIQSEKPADPYTNTQCQLLLYKAMISLFEQPYLHLSPPLHLAIHLLNVGQNSKESRIAATCQNGLNKLELLCQPVCPTLYVGSGSKSAQDDDGEQQTLTNEGKKIHILSDIVIKPSATDTKPEGIIYEEVTIEEVETYEEEIADDVPQFIMEKGSEEQGASIVDDNGLCEEEDNVCVVIEDDNVEESVVQNGDTENLVVNQNGHKEDSVVEIYDEPPTKKFKSGNEADSDESMLDSFVNVVNDY